MRRLLSLCRNGLGRRHYAHLYHGVSGRLLQPRCRLCLLAGKSRGLGLCGFLIDRRHQLLDALYCLEKTVPEGLPERRRNVRLDRNSGTYFDFCVLHAGLFEDVYECLRRDLLRCDKYGFRDQYRRLCQHQLRGMASGGSVNDFIRLLFCNLRRVHGRRLQDDPSDCLG